MKFFNLFLVSGLALTIVACDTKRNPYFSDDNAQFYVGSIKDDKVEEKADDAGAIYGARITFVACLKTLAGGGIPPRVRFEVQAGQDSIVSTTNKDGCIEWTEEHEFEPNQYERNLRLIRTFVSKNDYSGKVQHTIYWNNKSNKITSDIDTKTPPRGVEDPIEQSFTMGEAHLTKQNTAGAVQGEDPMTSTPDGQAQKSSTRLVLSSINLTRVKMSQETPFKISRHLDLLAQHTYQVGAAPKFYVKTFKNANEEVNLPGGKYKITLVFMDDPGIDLEKLSSELNQYKTAGSLSQAISKESEKLKKATEVMISNKEISVDKSLTDSDKKKILTTAMLEHVHSTAQFIADKTAEHEIKKYIDLQLKKLASLDVRSVLAVTVENVSTGQKQKLKGHGLGYINNLIDAGEVTLFQSPIEADQLYNAYTIERIQRENRSPLDLYLNNSRLALKERALVPMDLNNLSETDLQQNLFPTSYPFNKELEGFLSNTLDKNRKTMFMRALCVKMFSTEQTKVLDVTKNIPFGQNRQSWIDNCLFNQRIQMKYFDVQFFDFVESVDNSKVVKSGKSVSEKIEISRGFELNHSETQSGSVDHWSAILANYATDKVLGLAAGLSPVPGTAAALNYAKNYFPVVLGNDWYWAHTMQKSKSQQVGISRSSSESLSVNIDTYKINVETRRCAKVTYEPWVEKRFESALNIKLRQGFIACSTKPAVRQYTERFYMVTQQCSEANGTTDCASGEENGLRIMLRGEHIYRQFNQIMVDSNLRILLDPMGPEILKKKPDVWNGDVLEKQRNDWIRDLTGETAKIKQVFPGTLIPTIVN